MLKKPFLAEEKINNLFVSGTLTIQGVVRSFARSIYIYTHTQVYFSNDHDIPREIINKTG